MNLSDLIALLSSPAAYPHPAPDVRVLQTHISVVFLAGPFAYKVKKPVDMGFLDFRTLEMRRHFCEEEVRLNRRLAPDVYLGVVPVTAAGVREDAPAAEAVEWAVKMVRLPDGATLLERLRRGEAAAAVVTALARTLADFHRRADGGPDVAAFGRFDAVTAQARQNFEQAAPQVGVTVSPAVYLRLRRLTEGALEELRPLIEARAERGVPREGHGDLRLDHVYLFPDRPPPRDLEIIDCIEFSRELRCLDPVADVAFLDMDLLYHGRPDLAAAFAYEYVRAAGDAEGRRLLPFYAAYRALVRAKVEGLKQAEEEVPESEREASRRRARAYWLLALGLLEAPERRPCLLLVGGLPGVGKSTLSRGLSGHGFHVIRSDVVRKELFPDGGPAGFENGRYGTGPTERTYAECLRRAEGLLLLGERVLVDASFRDEQRRLDFLVLAESLAVPALFLHVKAGPEVVRARLARRRGDASDAGWEVYLEAARRWQPCGPQTRAVTREIDGGRGAEDALAAALAALHAAGLEDSGLARR